MADTRKSLRTWAISPENTALSCTPLTLRKPSLPLTPNRARSDSSATEDGDSSTLKPRTAHRPNYKPSFTKPTFQWIRGEILGQGSYGKVYLALNASTGEVMAVKQVEFPKTSSDKIASQQINVMEALRFEGDTLKDLNHPNIVSYLGYEESQDFLSIFLEYVPGGTVGSILQKNGRLREDLTKSWLTQILEGLVYLHQRGILHRDLKADNILVENTGVCKISDFGISKKASELTRAYTLMKGTPFWMAPEVLSSEGGGYDVKVDIWSVGCVAVEMWTGKRPWFGQNMFTVMFKVSSEKRPPPIPDDIPMSELAKGFQTLCFYPDPAERPHAAVLIKHPYLELTPGWVFNWDDLADNQKPPRSMPVILPNSKDTRATRPGSSDRSKPSRPPLAPLEIPPVSKGISLTSSDDQAGPPVVIITPPSTPKKTSTREQFSAPINSGQSSTPDRPYSSRRRLFVNNPDEEREPRSRPGSSRRSTPKLTQAFVFTPPPLPEPSKSYSPRQMQPPASSSFAPVATLTPTSLTSTSPSSATSSTFPTSGDTTPIVSKPPPLRPLPVPHSAPSLPRSSQPKHPAPSLRKRSSSSRDRTNTSAPNPAGLSRSATQIFKAPLNNLSIHPGPSAANSANRIKRQLPISPGQQPVYNVHNAYPLATPLSSVPAASSSFNTAAAAAAIPLPPPPTAPVSSSSALKPLRHQKSVPDVSIFAHSASRNTSRSRPITSGTFRRPSFIDFEHDESAEPELHSDAEVTAPPIARSSTARPLTSNNARLKSEHGYSEWNWSIQSQSQSSSSHPYSNYTSSSTRDRTFAPTKKWRPRTEDVYGNLEAWFPDVDLDQTVDSPADSVYNGSRSLTPRPGDGGQNGRAAEEEEEESPRQRHAEAHRSIRMIANEQNRLSLDNPAHLRRRTMLWGKHMEELKETRAGPAGPDTRSGRGGA